MAWIGLFQLQLHAQVPDYFCVDVAGPNQIEISWEVPNPINPNEEYNFYWMSPDNDWFAIGVESDLSNTPFGHNVDTQNGPQLYIIESIVNGQPAGESITVSSIFLEYTTLEQLSIAVLDWNLPFANIPPSSTFEIWRNVDGDGYQLLDVVGGTETSYVDTLFGLCTPSPEETINVKYYVELITPTCSMASQEISGGFRDSFGPIPPEAETILVNADGEVELYWYHSESPDVDRYLVQRYPSFESEAWVDDVPGVQPQYLLTDPATGGSTQLVVIAADGCISDGAPNGNLESFNQAYSTMWLDIAYAQCTDQAVLTWNGYDGWPEDVLEYQILMDFNNSGSYQVFATIESELVEEEIEYYFEIIPNAEYCFYIEAISNGSQRNSTSNRVCFKAEYPEPATFNYISQVSTLAENEIEIEIRLDPLGIQTRYDLYRSFAGSPYQKIDEYRVPVYPPGQSPAETHIFFDTDVDADITIYKYMLKGYDGCDNELSEDVFESNISENIVLVPTTSTEDLVNILNWNAYQGWDGDVQEYEIHRRLGSEEDFTYIQSVGPAETSWEENVESYMLEEGRFCYKIIAIENNNVFDKPAESHSSIACATQDPLMWIPNTIVINGVNDEFKPVAGFIDFETYEMEIRNRGGEQLFYTDDVEFGWTGSYQGRPVRDDYYMYIIKYQDGAGQHFVEQGVVYVLRAEKQ